MIARTNSKHGRELKIRITKTAIDGAEAQSKDTFLWDTEAKGFGLKVTPTGTKTYLVQYRLPGTPTRRHTIGRHGSPWTPQSARIEALRVLGLIAAGEDPSEKRRQAKADISVSELCDRYLKHGCATKKVSTRKFEARLLEVHVKPLLGRKAVRQVSQSDLQRFMNDVSVGKTRNDQNTKFRGRSIVKGGKSAANRTLGVLSPMFEFAILEGLIGANPARGIKKFKEGRPARFLSNAELARLGEAIRVSGNNGANPFALAGIQLLMLTGCRKSEILRLKWNEVDLDRGFLRLADSKSGAKVIPLGSPASSILKNLPRALDNPHVLPGEKPGEHFVGLQKVWAGVRDRAGLVDVRLHDLRHSFASVGARSGESLIIIGKVLGHATASATSRYAHLSDDPSKNAAQLISSQVWDAMNDRVGGD